MGVTLDRPLTSLNPPLGNSSLSKTMTITTTLCIIFLDHLGKLMQKSSITVTLNSDLESL